MKINPLTAIDFYKADHRRQYPDGTEVVYSNFTPRTGKYANTDLGGIIFFGLQGFIKTFLIEAWKEGFFLKDKAEVVSAYKRRMDNALGPDAISVEHIEALHDLGYLPIEIKALPEGSFVPYGVPVLTIVNTKPKFFWITNYLESVMSAELWKASTSATTAYAYYKEFARHGSKVGYGDETIQWQGHDFSFRGMGGLADAVVSGAGHLTSFTGTDTVSAIDYLEEYYNGNSDEELLGGSVPASEHSVMCMGTFEGEEETFKRFITELYPSGIVSIVSDTWDFWQVVTEFMPRLKSEIMYRNGRVVLRPDSGDPVDIICGTGAFNDPDHVRKGAYELLWETFGGVVNDKGFKVLDTHIGLIYGDSITLERQKEILRRLEMKGFSASNLVLGIGSYTYQFCTRDTHGFAMKATWGVVNGEEREIFKDPKTDNGMKKSAKGLLKVDVVNGSYVLRDQVSVDDEDRGCLTTVFKNGGIVKEHSISEIRERVKSLEV